MIKSDDVVVPNIKLVVGDGKPLTNAAIPVRWCLSKATLEKIASEDGESSAQIIIVAMDDRGYQHRTIAPLSQGMTYINLNRAGINKIHALILYNPKYDYSVKAIKDMYLSKETRNHFEACLIVHDDVISPYSSTVCSYINTNHFVSIDVPIELFGKEPPEWLKGLVNTWQDSSMDDQCSWRRRVMFFAFVKSWVMLTVAVLSYILHTFLVVFMVFIGIRPHKMDYSFLKRPLLSLGNINEFFSDIPSFNHIVYDKKHQFKLWRMLLVPAYVSVLVFIGDMLLNIPWSLDNVVMLLYMMGASLATPFVLILGVMYVVNNFKSVRSFGSWLNNKLIAPIIKWDNERKLKATIKYNALMKERYLESVSYLSCINNSEASVCLVPKQNMTMKLRYDAIKNKVCKPMMR